MKNFLSAGAVIAALGLIPSAAHATCTKSGVVYSVVAGLPGAPSTTTTIKIRSPNLNSSTTFFGTTNIPNYVTIGKVGASVTITGSVASCPASGSLGVINQISAP